MKKTKLTTIRRQFCNPGRQPDGGDLSGADHAADLLEAGIAEGTDALDFDAEKLLIFCGGFIAIAAVNIYVFFVRHK